MIWRKCGKNWGYIRKIDHNISGSLLFATNNSCKQTWLLPRKYILSQFAKQKDKQNITKKGYLRMFLLFPRYITHGTHKLYFVHLILKEHTDQTESAEFCLQKYILFNIFLSNINKLKERLPFTIMKRATLVTLNKQLPFPSCW